MNLKGQTWGLQKSPYKLNGNNVVNKIQPTVFDVETLKIGIYVKDNALSNLV